MRQEFELDDSQAEHGEVVGTSMPHEGEYLSVAVGHCMSGLQKVKIVGNSKDWQGGGVNHMLP